MHRSVWRENGKEEGDRQKEGIGRRDEEMKGRKRKMKEEKKGREREGKEKKGGQNK